MSTSSKGIIERIQEVTAKIKNIEKTLEVGTGRNVYKAVADADVLREVKKAEEKAGVTSIAIGQEVISSEVVNFIDGYGKPKINYVDVLKMTTRFYCTEDEAKFVDVVTHARGVDAQDKGFGKASTYARKYALLNAYKITTGEDNDDSKSDEVEAVSGNIKLMVIENYAEKDIEYKNNLFQHFNIGSYEEMNQQQINSTYKSVQKKVGD